MLLVAFLVLAGIAVGIYACLRFRTSVAAWSLLVLCAAWLPVNNHEFEGPVLVRVNNHRGLTGGDLAGWFGFLVAVCTLLPLVQWRDWTRRGPARTAAVWKACIGGVIMTAGVGGRLSHVLTAGPQHEGGPTRRTEKGSEDDVGQHDRNREEHRTSDDHARRDLAVRRMPRPSAQAPVGASDARPPW